MTTRSFFIGFLFLQQIFYSQTVEIFQYDSVTNQKLMMIRDLFSGDWMLANKLIIGREKKDTLDKKVYNTSKASPAASRPKIIMSFRYGGELVITEFPIGEKISVARARWSVEVRSSDDPGPFFVRVRTYSYYSEKSFYEFSGFITDFDSNHFQITDESKLLKTNQWTVLNFVRLRL